MYTYEEFKQHGKPNFMRDEFISRFARDKLFCGD